MSYTPRGRLLAASVLAAVVALALVSSSAHAQAVGATDVDINLPNIVVLHYFSNVDISINAATLEAFLGYSGNDVDEGTTSASNSFSPDLDISSSLTAPTGDPTAAQLVLTNAWAVRALGGAGSSIQIAIANTDSTLTNAVGGSITVSAVGVQTGGGGFAGTQTFAPTGLSTPKVGDVRLTLNMASAVRSGDYLDGVYTLTVTNL